MTERPILFSGPMVRAILDGRKTQTRRVVKPHPADWTTPNGPGMSAIWPAVRSRRGLTEPMHCPYGQPGDRLWVREARRPIRAWNGSACGCTIEYRSDGATRDFNSCIAVPDTVAPWRPSIHMPRCASRIALEVTGVRVERLQDITEADARAEGAPRSGHGNRPHFMPGEAHGYRLGYANLWDAINAKRGAGWDANPWVWVIELRRVEK